MFFHPATAVELTLATALQAVKEVEGRWKGLGTYLRVPKSVLDGIERQFPTNAARMEAVVKYWLGIDPTPSWRKIITTLDWMKAHDVADRIRNRAEPLTGRSCTAYCPC